MVLLQSTPKKQTLPMIRQQRSLQRGINLRNNANVLSSVSFQNRRAYMVQAYKDGAFLADPESRGKPRPNPMTDPAMMEGMMGMMKGNVAMMVPQTLIMGWINAFFSGFVISTSAVPYGLVIDSMLYHVKSGGGQSLTISLTLNSETAFPIDSAIQIYATVWRGNPRSRCPVGLQLIVVLLDAVWPTTGV